MRVPHAAACESVALPHPHVALCACWACYVRVLLQVVAWEHFLDLMSASRLQDEYNLAIAQCELFVMLFHTKVGRYTREEFETAFGAFKAKRTPDFSKV